MKPKLIAATPLIAILTLLAGCQKQVAIVNPPPPPPHSGPCVRAARAATNGVHPRH